MKVDSSLHCRQSTYPDIVYIGGCRLPVTQARWTEATKNLERKNKIGLKKSCLTKMFATKILARRVSRPPVNTHFLKKLKENSLDLLQVYGETWLLDAHFLMSG